MRLLLVTFLIGFGTTGASEAQDVVAVSDLKADEVVEFLPTWAVRVGDRWNVPVDAWVYEPEEDDRIRSSVLEGVDEVLELAGGDPETRARILSNLRPFLVDNERGKRLVLRLGSVRITLPESLPNGRAKGWLALPVGEMDAAARSPWLTLEVVLRRGDERRFRAHAQLLEDAGLSVISDIDDTIKVSEVHDRRRLLANTFARPPRAAPGLSTAYRRWAAAGADFHYVSSSPLPLVAMLRGFLESADFPRGSMALRPFRWKDGSALDLLGTDDFKGDTIAQIIGAFERRQFVLVGDVGERDPEIYGELARAFPERVKAIWLRDPLEGGTPGLDERLETVFDGLPEDLWSVFVDGAELPQEL